MLPKFTQEKLKRLLNHVRFLLADGCLSQQKKRHNNALELKAKTRQIHIKAQANILK